MTTINNDQQRSTTINNDQQRSTTIKPSLHFLSLFFLLFSCLMLVLACNSQQPSPMQSQEPNMTRFYHGYADEHNYALYYYVSNYDNSHWAEIIENALAADSTVLYTNNELDEVKVLKFILDNLESFYDEELYIEATLATANEFDIEYLKCEQTIVSLGLPFDQDFLQDFADFDNQYSGVNIFRIKNSDLHTELSKLVDLHCGSLLESHEIQFLKDLMYISCSDQLTASQIFNSLEAEIDTFLANYPNTDQFFEESLYFYLGITSHYVDNISTYASMPGGGDVADFASYSRWYNTLLFQCYGSSCVGPPALMSHADHESLARLNSDQTSVSFNIFKYLLRL